MAKTPNEIWRDYATDGVPASGLWNPPKADIREWATQIDIYSNASGYTLVFQTRASLYASLDHDANQMAWVVEDTNFAYNGIYQKLGASGTGSWVRVADLPFSYVAVVDDGLSTANAMSMESSLPVTFGSMISVIVPLTNTSTTVTIAFNGGDALAVKTASGGNPPVGSLIQDMVVVGYVDDVSLEFRLFTDIASAAIQTAAAASATSASDSATSATASATLAGKWATEAEDVPVTGSLYSAYHWAKKAMAYVTGSIAAAIHGATSKSAPTALDEFAIADSAASWGLKKVTAESVMSGPQGYIYGLAMTNNTTDATNDIDFAAGVAASDTSPFYRMTASALTKRLDAAWTVGNNQGMLDTGTIADGTYNLFEIQRSDTLVVDFLASLSSSSPTMPSGYNRKRLIGYVVRSGGVNGLPSSSSASNSISYTSPALSVTAGGTFTLTHGLGSTPKTVDVYAVCKVADGGYSVGDRLYNLDGSRFAYLSTANAGLGIAITATSTTITGRYGNYAPLSTLHKTTGVSTVLTNTNWDVFVVAIR